VQRFSIHGNWGNSVNALNDVKALKSAIEKIPDATKKLEFTNYLNFMVRDKYNNKEKTQAYTNFLNLFEWVFGYFDSINFVKPPPPTDSRPAIGGGHPNPFAVGSTGEVPKPQLVTPPAIHFAPKGNMPIPARNQIGSQEERKMVEQHLSYRRGEPSRFFTDYTVIPFGIKASQSQRHVDGSDFSMFEVERGGDKRFFAVIISKEPDNAFIVPAFDLHTKKRELLRSAGLDALFEVTPHVDLQLYTLIPASFVYSGGTVMVASPNGRGRIF